MAALGWFIKTSNQLASTVTVLPRSLRPLPPSSMFAAFTAFSTASALQDTLSCRS